DEFSGRSPGDLGPAPLAAFLFQQKVSRIGQRRDPPPCLDPTRVPFAERSLQVEPAPLRPYLKPKTLQHRRGGDLLGHRRQERRLLLVEERSCLGPGLSFRPISPSPSHRLSSLSQGEERRDFHS